MGTIAIHNLDSEYRKTPDYLSASEFLFDRIDFERVARMPYSRREMNLARVSRLLALLGDPHEKLNLIHVAGTKGKGSTSVFLSSVFAAAGMRCGSYTSPHLQFVEERFCVNGQSCDPRQMCELIEQVRGPVQQMDDEASLSSELGRPTFFEISTAIAFLFFLSQQVDIAVVEVGLGGRLDSTNVCRPLVSVITNISFDHMKQLGNTLTEIATEKAGIIKPGIPVVSGVMNPEAKATIARIAHSRGVRLVQMGDDFDCSNYRPGQQDRYQCDADFVVNDGPRAATEIDVRIGLLGRHQVANAAVAMATLMQLPDSLRPSSEAIRTGFETASCPARIEVVREDPLVIVDAGHNVASIEAIASVLIESFPKKRKRLLVAATKGKDAAGMLQVLLPLFDEVVCTRYEKNPRSVEVEKLHLLVLEVARELKLDSLDGRVSAADSPLSAWDEISRNVAESELICVTGSFFIAAEMRQLLLHSVR